MIQDNWPLPAFGLIVGLLVGLTGMGGGILMTPFLLLGMGLAPTTAVGTDLAYGAVTKLAGGWQHWRQGTVNRRVVAHLALGSVPATLLAVGLLIWLRHTSVELTDAWLKRAIAAMLVVSGALMISRLVRPRGQPAPRPVPAYRPARLVAIGALGGFLVGLTSIGSGSVIIALLVLVAPLSSDQLVGTDVAHAFVLVAVAALAHLLFLSNVDLATVALLLVGSIPGVLMGSRLTVWVPRRLLQAGLASLLMSTAVAMLR